MQITTSYGRNCKALIPLLTEFLLSTDIPPDIIPIVSNIIYYSKNPNNTSSNYNNASNHTNIIYFISLLLSKCDNLPLETRASLEERLEIEMNNEKKEILSLYPRPKQDSTGRWRARPYGKGNRKELVKATLKEWDNAIIQYHHEQQKKALTLSEVLKEYNNSRDDITDNTKLHNLQDMKRFAKCLLDRPITSITALEIQKAYVSAVLESKATKKACNNYKGLLRRVFKYANKHLGCKTIDINDCIEDLNTEINKSIFKKKDNFQLFEYPEDRFTKDEIQKLIDEVKTRDTLKAYACLISLYTGQRIGEIVAMTKDDLVIADNLIYIRHSAKVNKLTKEYYIGDPKMGKNRVIVFPEIAKPIFERILELGSPNSPYLFFDSSPNKKCDWFTIRKLDHELANINKAIGTKTRKSAHDLRRTYDSILDEAIMSSALRHLLLGHELTGIDANYLRDNHGLPEVQETVNSAFNQYFGYKLAT